MSAAEEKRSHTHWSWLWALLLLALAAGWFAWGTLGAQPPTADMSARQQAEAASGMRQNKAHEPFAVEVVRVRLREHAPVLRLTGRAEAAQELTLRSRAAGEVIATPAKEGAPVKKGDVLCRLDETSERADLAAAQAALASAERDAQAAQRLFRRGTLPEAQLKQAEARLQQARATVRRAELALQWRVMRAPFDAVLHRQQAKVGDMLAIGGACAVLARLDPLKVVAFASELEVARLRLGMAAVARFAAGPVLHGKLSYIAPVAEAATRTFRIEATMSNPTTAQGMPVVRAGMTARLEVRLPPLQVAELPLSALVLADGGQLGVHVVGNDDRVAFAPLRIIKEGRDAVLASGLKDGEKLIVTGQYYVKPGTRVKAVPQGRLARTRDGAGQESTP